MAEQLAACARQLFEGVSGSDEQRAANSWLMQFQVSDQAWGAALQLLEQPPKDAATQQNLTAPELVAMQILRLKTQQEWRQISLQQRQIVRQTLLKLLEATCISDGGLSAVSCRIACVTVADIIVKSCQEWPSWKSDVQRLVNAGVAAQRQQKSAAVLAEILGAIPLQILASERLWTKEEMLDMLNVFQAESEEVMKAVQMILSNMPEEQSNALRCLEGWIIGCVPAHETFGLNAAHLFSRGLMDVLFNIAVSDSEEQSQLAAGIITDSFVHTASAPLSETMLNAVIHAGRRLVDATPLFYSDVRSPTSSVDRELQTVTCRGLSRIACSLAMNHAPALFSPHGSYNSGEKTHFPLEFLELLLACSAHKDIDVVQPTLEIWFFFLEESSSQNEISLELFGDASQEQIVTVLSRLVNSLVDHCKYPQSFVDTQQVSSDDPEIEAIVTLRREIADTLLSLFSKWPGGPGKPKGDYVSCVMGMSQMLSDSKDVAMIDALFFLLSYLVELFDVVSSDSESEEDQIPLDVPASGGVDVLLGILDCAPNLPMHPLVISGITRYLRSLGASLALPASVYLRASLVICQGLQFSSSFPVAVQSLLHSSSFITKYADVEEKALLLQALLAFCNSPLVNTTQESEGDLLEVTFRIASGASDSDFGALCSSVLSNLTLHVQSTNPVEARSCVYLLGRALGGVQDQRHGHALVDQLWPLIINSLQHHKADVTCCRAGVQFFLNVIPFLQKGDIHHPIEAQILDVCLCWYSERVAPDILTCCSRIIAKQQGNTSFQAEAHQTFERLLAAFRAKLRDVSEAGFSTRQQTMEDFLTQDNDADQMIPEVEQFMKLTREMLGSFPQILLQPRPNGDPTLYWVCLDLSTRILKIDHLMQEMCDAACDFLLDAMRCQPDPILERITVFTTEIMRVVLGFLGPKRGLYRVRNLWDFLFQCLHAPQISTQIRGGFLSAITTVVLEEGALRSLLPADVWQQLPGELRMRRQRHRFRQYFSLLAHSMET